MQQKDDDDDDDDDRGEEIWFSRKNSHADKNRKVISLNMESNYL